MGRLQVADVIVQNDTRKSCQWRLHAGPAQPSMPAFQRGLWWRLQHAILLCALDLCNDLLGPRPILTRQTILLHFLHSPTISRAQAPTLPLVRRSTLRPSRPYMVQASKLLLRASPSSAAGLACSLSHRRLCPMRDCRNRSRFALTCRHVRANSWSEVKSNALASCDAMLRLLLGL